MSENDETETPARPRTSRFKEHTNTTSSIHPPPNELWKDLGIEDMLDEFNEENAAPPAASKGGTRKTPIFGKPVVAPPTAPESTNTLGRFSRAFASVFGSVLGKRKAGASDAEKEKLVLDERKQAADEAYHALKVAQQQGLMPTPKVFRRPVVFKEGHVVGNTTPAPRTPGTLYRSPSKKELVKHKKLSKRVSDLEFKLASARKELNTVLHKDVPPVPSLPKMMMLPKEHEKEKEKEKEKASPDSSDAELSQDTHITTPSQTPIGKIIKKRKAISTDDERDETYKPIPTDSEADISHPSARDLEPDSHARRSIKRVKSSSSTRSARLTKRQSKRDLRRDEAVRIVPDGKRVPDVPRIPAGVGGRVARVDGGNDGYGGLGHEMF